MKSIVFDSGPIISLALNNLLWLLEPLKQKFGGGFYIPTSVKNEIVDRPISTRIFKFEALQVQNLIDKGILQVIYNNEINSYTNHLLTLSNNSFTAKGNPIHILHPGEVQVIATAIFLESDAIVVDERMTRIMIENPDIALKILRHKLHTSVKPISSNAREFRKHTQDIKVIRSVELVTLAYELGLLDPYLPKREGGRRMLLDGVLWGVKLKGCSVSPLEIERILKIEKV